MRLRVEEFLKGHEDIVRRKEPSHDRRWVDIDKDDDIENNIIERKVESLVSVLSDSENFFVKISDKIREWIDDLFDGEILYQGLSRYYHFAEKAAVTYLVDFKKALRNYETWYIVIDEIEYALVVKNGIIYQIYRTADLSFGTNNCSDYFIFANNHTNLETLRKNTFSMVSSFKKKEIAKYRQELFSLRKEHYEKMQKFNSILKKGNKNENITK